MSDVLRAPGSTRPGSSRPASPAPVAPDAPAPPIADPTPADRPGTSPDPPEHPNRSATPAKDQLHDAIQKSADKAQEADNAPRPGAEPIPPTEPPPVAPVAADGKKPKVNPWKERDEWRAKAVAAEAEVQRIKNSVLPENDKVALTERTTKAETRAAELENAIAFKDYEQSSEFRDKFHKPFVDAFQEAMTELGELQVTDPNTGEQRFVTGDDFAKLANLGLKEAKAAAVEMFGEFADTAMEHRSHIRRVSEARSQAMKDAKENAAARTKKIQEAFQSQHKAIVEAAIVQVQALESDIMSNPKLREFLRPKVAPEGQQLTPEEQEWNDDITSGYARVDSTFAKAPSDHSLTPEQRQKLIEQRFEVRNCAAAYKPLKKLYLRALEKIKALESDVAQYSASTPATGGSIPASPGHQPTSARAQLHQALEQTAMRRR